MAAFTSKASGNASATGQTTWNEAGAPGASDTVTVNAGHTITIDVNTTWAGLTMNGPVTVAATKVFTLAGNCIQGNAAFTLGAASELVFSTAGGTRKWLQGTANSQTNCKIVLNGTAGNIAKIRVTGGGFAYFDGGDEGSGSIANCGGWDLTYYELNGLGHPTLPWCIRSNDFGLHNRRFVHGTFDNCKTQFAVTYNWAANSNADWRVESTKWINQPAGAMGMRFVNAYTGSGVLSFEDNAVGEPADGAYCMTFACNGVTAKRTFFASAPSMSGQVNCSIDETCVVRESSKLQLCSLYFGQNKAPAYFLCDHVDIADRIFGTNNIGNAHMTDGFGAGITSDAVMEYPHELLIDGPDGIYGKEDGSYAGSTIQRCLVIPSMTDGYAGLNLHPMVQQNNQLKIYHCTVVGRNAFLVFNERLVNGTTPVLEAKSNLIAGVANSDTHLGYSLDAAWIGFCVFEPGTNCGTDSIPPAGIKNNYIYKGGLVTDGTPGASKAVHLRQSAPPDGTNIFDDTTGPQFVDPTRCAARWAVHKGYVGAEPAQPALPVAFPAWNAWYTWKRAALDAVVTALMADPTLGSTDLAVWVKAGFVPQNSALDGTAHDGGTIGAMPFGGAAAPPPATKFLKALGR